MAEETEQEIKEHLLISAISQIIFDGAETGNPFEGPGLYQCRDIAKTIVERWEHLNYEASQQAWEQSQGDSI